MEDAVIVGGGIAGLQAAIQLGRSSRRCSGFRVWPFYGLPQLS